MSAVDIQQVTEKPNLGKEIARAVLTSRGRTGARGALPARALQLPAATVDRDQLHAYQRLCSLPVSDELPPLFPHLLGFPLQARLMAAKDFPLPMAGLVHVRNASTLHRRLGADEVLDITVRAENLSGHRKGVTVDLTASATVAGELVWDSTSTYLHRAKPSPDAAPEPEAPGVPEGRQVARWKLPADLGRRYAAVSGDVNPIHLSPLTAKAMGFPRAIAHGMWTGARTLAALGPTAAGPGSTQIWFRKPVLLPSAVSLVRQSEEDRLVAALVGGSAEKRRTHLVLEFTPQD